MRLVEQQELRRRAREWFEQPEQVSHYRQEVATGGSQFETMLLEALPPSGSVVDIGCGAGRIMRELIRRGHRPVGADVSRTLLKEARASVGERRGVPPLVLVDGVRLPFPHGAFDAAVVFKVLGYIPSRSLRKRYLREIHRILRPPGTVVLTYATAPSSAIRSLGEDRSHRVAAAQFTSLEVGDTFCDGAGFVHWFTPAALRSELMSSPFDVVSINEDRGPGGASMMGGRASPPSR